MYFILSGTCLMSPQAISLLEMIVRISISQLIRIDIFYFITTFLNAHGQISDNRD